MAAIAMLQLNPSRKPDQNGVGVPKKRTPGLMISEMMPSMK